MICPLCQQEMDASLCFYETRILNECHNHELLIRIERVGAEAVPYEGYVTYVFQGREYTDAEFQRLLNLKAFW